MKLPLLVSAISLLFASCQKDLVAPEEQVLTAETVSSDATVNDLPETVPPSHKAIVTNVNGNVAGYWETLPARYYQTTKNYPFILFIHGIGELGTNLSRINCCGLPRHAATKTFPAQFVVNGQKFSFIVMSPQFKRRPSAAEMQNVIDYAKRKYRIDPTRIYVAGLSMGGGSTWDYSAVYGQNAAAIVPVCGGTRPSTSLARSVAQKWLPVWTISSTADRLVPIQWAKDWIGWIDKNNSGNAANTKLTVWTGEDHNSTWARAFNPATRVDGANIYEWLLRYRRTTSSAKPTTTPAPAPTPAPAKPAPAAPKPTSTFNHPPVAGAGWNQTVPRSYNYVRLNATQYTWDYDGYIRAFRWVKISGPSTYRLDNANAGNTVMRGAVPGTYIFRVYATDNRGATDYDDVRIRITP